MLSNCVMENSLTFPLHNDVMNMQSLMDELNNMLATNINIYQ